MKNYVRNGGLSWLVHGQINEEHAYKVQGPMGKGLEIENKRDMEEQMDSETREFVNDMML